MRRLITVSLLWAGQLVGQIPAVDRPPGTSRPARQRIERRDQGFLGDFFRIGNAGEVWMIEALTVWAIPAAGPACGRELGDSIEKITLLGALDNPPVPGQPVCDCHALLALGTVSFERGSSASQNPGATLTPENGAWRIDFKNVRWSVPGGADVLFSLRATARTRNSCHADTAFALAATPAEGYRLHRLNAKGVPMGLADPEPQPRSIDIRVWARRSSE